MSNTTTRRIVSVLVLFLAFAFAAQAQEEMDLSAKIAILSSNPLMETLQAHQIGSEERTVAYIYKNRIEYYDNELVAQIKKVNKLPKISKDGALYTDVFVTQFRSGNEIYLVQRGWKSNGNCSVTTTKIGTDGFVEEGDSCSGDPCSYCEPFDPDLGCRCRIGERCNHTTGGAF